MWYCAAFAPLGPQDTNVISMLKKGSSPGESRWYNGRDPKAGTLEKAVGAPYCLTLSTAAAHSKEKAADWIT